MSKLKIISPAGAFGKYEGEDELTSLLRKIAIRYSKDPDGEWADKYGTDFENDEFIMRTYYWGDCDCGWDEHDFDEPHSKSCFQTKIEKFRKELTKKGVDWLSDKWTKEIGKWSKENGNKDGWSGSGVYCDCEHDINFKKWFEKNKKGENGHSDKCALELPNFLHKKTGFEVRWYKYLGRGMEVNMKPPIKELNKLIWARGVKRRDNNTCWLSDENCKGYNMAHHIYPWRNYPKLRYKLSNGITLCQAHHPMKRVKEELFRKMFSYLVKQK